MGNSCQSCISDRHTVTTPPHGREGSSPDQHFPTDLPIPTTSSPALSHHEGSSLPPQPPINSLPSSPLSIDSINLRIQKVDPADQIEPLISFVDYHLQRIKGSSQEASSSSSHLTSVASNTTLAAQFMDFISTEAENLQKTDIAKEMGGLALEGLKKVGEAHWVFLGLSVVASALERCVTVRSNVSECIDLLQAIVFLAKDLKVFRERMPDERERLCGAVQMIVEGAIMCSDYISKDDSPGIGSQQQHKTNLERPMKV